MLGVLVGFFVTMQLPWGTDCGSSWWWKEGEGGRWVHCQPWTPNCNLRQMLLKTTNTCWKPMLFPDGISSGAAWKEEEAVGAYATTVHVWLLFTPSGSLWVPLEASFLCSVPATPWRLPWAAALSTCFVCYPLPLALYALKNQGNFPSVRDSAVFFAVLIEAGGVLMCVCVYFCVQVRACKTCPVFTVPSYLPLLNKILELDGPRKSHPLPLASLESTLACLPDFVPWNELWSLNSWSQLGFQLQFTGRTEDASIGTHGLELSG